jgi:hypothetical protein
MEKKTLCSGHNKGVIMGGGNSGVTQKECNERLAASMERHHQQELIVQELRRGYELVHEVVKEFKGETANITEKVRQLELKIAGIEAIAQQKARAAGIWRAIAIGIGCSFVAGIFVWRPSNKSRIQKKKQPWGEMNDSRAVSFQKQNRQNENETKLD